MRLLLVWLIFVRLFGISAKSRVPRYCLLRLHDHAATRALGALGILCWMLPEVPCCATLVWRVADFWAVRVWLFRAFLAFSWLLKLVTADLYRFNSHHWPSGVNMCGACPVSCVCGAEAAWTAAGQYAACRALGSCEEWRELVDRGSLQ